jgi:hypothetical protein
VALIACVHTFYIDLLERPRISPLQQKNVMDICTSSRSQMAEYIIAHIDVQVEANEGSIAIVGHVFFCTHVFTLQGRTTDQSTQRDKAYVYPNLEDYRYELKLRITSPHLLLSH